MSSEARASVPTGWTPSEAMVLATFSSAVFSAFSWFEIRSISESNSAFILVTEAIASSRDLACEASSALRSSSSEFTIVFESSATGAGTSSVAFLDFLALGSSSSSSSSSMGSAAFFLDLTLAASSSSSSSSSASSAALVSFLAFSNSLASLTDSKIPSFIFLTIAGSAGSAAFSSTSSSFFSTSSAALASTSSSSFFFMFLRN